MAKFISPGRIEILGNHTDHNHGQVLVSAITLETKATAEIAQDGIVRVRSEGYDDIVFDVNDTVLNENERGSSKAVIKGVFEGFKRRGFNVGAFTASMSSNVPKGAGVSSSASFELIICEILNVFFNSGKIDKMTLAKIAQFSENVYMGKPCGLLDQAGIALGGVTHIDFKDIESPKVKSIPLKLDGYKIVIISTGGDHSDLTEDYRAVKDDMHNSAGFFKKEFLADIDGELFFNSLHDAQKDLSGRAMLRAMHFFDENKRVQEACGAIMKGDTDTFFRAVKASGESSYKLLQNCYCPLDTEQRIPLALYISQRLLNKGAYRVHGGGFRGTILAFVHDSEFERYDMTMRRVFGAENVFVSDFSPMGVRQV